MLTAGLLNGIPAGAIAQDSVTSPVTLESAQRAFYNANYLDAAEQARELRTANPDDLPARELRTAAILFQLKRLIGEDTPDRERALKQCAECASLIDTFREEVTEGREVARARLERAPEDLDALFYLGKLDLNFVWLYLGPLNKRTGWTEYREARRSMETILKSHPSHVRARIARAWIEYIVDTKVMFGFKWVLGGGDRRKALTSVRQAAATDALFFDKVEARFALWEMLAREKQTHDAIQVAQGLLGDFPQNRELAKFIQRQRVAP